MVKSIQLGTVFVSDTEFIPGTFKVDDLITIKNNNNVFTGKHADQSDYTDMKLLIDSIQRNFGNVNYSHHIAFIELYSLVWYFIGDYNRLKASPPTSFDRVKYIDDEYYIEITETFSVNIFNGESNGMPRIRYSTGDKHIELTTDDYKMLTSPYVIEADFWDDILGVDFGEYLINYEIGSKFKKPLTLGLDMKGYGDEKDFVDFVLPLYDENIEKIDKKWAFWLDTSLFQK